MWWQRNQIGGVDKKIPKPLIKFNNEPFIDKILKFYQRYQFNKIYLLAGYRSEMFMRRYNNKVFNFIKINVIIEKFPMNTGALYKLKKIKIIFYLLTLIVM